MRPNTFKAKLVAGHSATLGWCTCGHPLAVETIAHVGFDAVALDMQHGAIDAGELLSALQAISTGAAIPIVRVPANDPASIMKALDFGAYGVICPMIETAADVARFVAACRYPPQGVRSYGPTRARLYAGAHDTAAADATVLAIAMIETRAAMENLEAILAVPGLDAVFVGPADLSQAFGGPPGADWREGVVPPLLERVVQLAHAARVPAGIFCRSAEYAAQMVARGFGFVTLNSDLAYLEAGAQRSLQGFAAALAIGTTPPA
jgi:4-hydroxy-2-oxoheptanedioate aldolase